MYMQMVYKQIVGEVNERNRFFKALQEIQKIAENIDENNFEALSELIAKTSKQALKSRPNKLSKKMKEFMKDLESNQEVILSGEIYEKFQV